MHGEKARAEKRHSAEAWPTDPAWATDPQALSRLRGASTRGPLADER